MGRASRFRQLVRGMNEARLLILRALIAIGFGAFLFYLAWWLDSGRLASPWLVIAFSFAMLYAGPQLIGNWILYLAARPTPGPPPAQTGLTVDVFVTAYQEPYAMIERTLAAACAMRGDHHTWLLDDGATPAFAPLAARLGAGYLTRSDRIDAKAGNINAALARTTGDIIVVFDADHVPAADFLERTIGHFADPKIGFVQVMLTFSNGGDSWVARAASETSSDFYNPTSLGSNRLGGATMMGSNALIRRAALKSIGGYRPGLAEDLATSLALHASGWRSTYVPEPLAPGLAPPDLPAWFTQQLKWARGVFEVFLTEFPRCFAALTWGQRLCYAVRMTYYWIGFVVMTQLGVSGYLILSRSSQMDGDLYLYLIHLFPLVTIAYIIRQFALWSWRHPSVLAGLLWRATAIIYATSPVYVLAWTMAVLRIRLRFRITPKMVSARTNPIWLLPQVLIIGLVGGAGAYGLATQTEPDSALLYSFTFLQSIPMLVILAQWGLSLRRAPLMSNRNGEDVDNAVGGPHVEVDLYHGV